MSETQFNIIDLPVRTSSKAGVSKYNPLFDLIKRLPEGKAVEIPNPAELTVASVRGIISDIARRRGVRVAVNHIDGKCFLSKRKAAKS